MRSVEDEWERQLEADDDLDLLFVEYDAGRIKVEDLIEEIETQGFQAEVKPEATVRGS